MVRWSTKLNLHSETSHKCDYKTMQQTPAQALHGPDKARVREIGCKTLKFHMYIAALVHRLCTNWTRPPKIAMCCFQEVRMQVGVDSTVVCIDIHTHSRFVRRISLFRSSYKCHLREYKHRK